MLAPVLLFLLQLPAGVEDPRGVVARATRAIEGDSATRVAREWSARARKDSTDWAARLGLATLARLSYNYRAADSAYQSLRRSTDRRAASYVIAASMGLGNGLQTRGANAAADSAYQFAADAARRSGQRELEGAALVALASVRSRTVGVPAAAGLLRQAGELIPTDDLLGLSALHCGQAALMQMSGRAGVESEASLGADLARRAGSVRQRAFCERVLAVAVMDRSSAGNALLQTVVDDLTAARDRAALASVLQWRGYRSFLEYNFGASRTDLLRAVAEGQATGAQSATAWALLDLAQLAAWSDDPISARQYGDSAEALFESQGDRWGLGMLRSIQSAAAYLGGDLPRARRLQEEALRSAEATGATGTIVSVQTGRALLEMDEGNLAEAQRWLDRARGLAHVNHMAGYEDGLTFHYARLALLRNQPGVAIRQLETSLRVSHPNQPAVDYQWRVRLAVALMQQGNAAAAERELRRASDALDSTRAHLADQALRTVVLQSLRDVRDPHLGVPQVLAGLVSAGRTNAAFELAERWKGRNLLDRLLLRDAFDSRRAPAPRAGAARFVASSTAATAAALPDEHTAILEYVTGSEGAPTTLFVLTRKGVDARLLPPFDSISADVRRFMTMVEGGEDPRDLGKRVGMALLAPAIERLPAGVTHLMIVPDAGLQRLAFDALELSDGRRLAERFSVSLAPSAAVAERLWTLPAHAGQVSLLALGDPRFAIEAVAGTETAVYRKAFGANGGLARLPASAGEARAVARYASAPEVRLRELAGEAYLKHADLRRFRVLHFAAHALVDEQSPTRTALALSPGEGEDGYVTAADLAGLDLDADLVVLSACRTAGGVFVRGEGVEGLTAPLIEAGARSVVASLWRVGDKTTADFVERYYAAIAAGASNGDALANVKRDAIRRGVPPSVWAAFVLVGDPTIRIPLQTPSPVPWPAVGLVAVLIVAGYGLTIRRRRMVERT